MHIDGKLYFVDADGYNDSMSADLYFDPRVDKIEKRKMQIDHMIMNDNSEKERTVIL